MSNKILKFLVQIIANRGTWRYEHAKRNAPQGHFLRGAPQGYYLLRGTFPAARRLALTCRGELQSIAAKRMLSFNKQAYMFCLGMFFMDILLRMFD
ncbi:MAG: hypothetical protein KKB30_02335 [Proteobacteria bacterium]|nr:hypothetical protein [Pseudomonadota bacterium]MBU1715829.1 hypothetical protein [Pseudomonadota bacterium]